MSSDSGSCSKLRYHSAEIFEPLEAFMKHPSPSTSDTSVGHNTQLAIEGPNDARSQEQLALTYLPASAMHNDRSRRGSKDPDQILNSNQTSMEEYKEYAVGRDQSLRRDAKLSTATGYMPSSVLAKERGIQHMRTGSNPLTSGLSKLHANNHKYSLATQSTYTQDANPTRRFLPSVQMAPSTNDRNFETPSIDGIQSMRSDRESTLDKHNLSREILNSGSTGIPANSQYHSQFRDRGSNNNLNQKEFRDTLQTPHIGSKNMHMKNSSNSTTTTTDNNKGGFNSFAPASSNVKNPLFSHLHYTNNNNNFS